MGWESLDLREKLEFLYKMYRNGGNGGGSSDSDGVVANENTVEVLRTNSSNTDFVKAHGSVLVGNKIFLSTREGASSKCVVFSDYNNLAAIQLVTNVGVTANLDSIVYVAAQNKVYMPISATNKMFVVDTITLANSVQTIALPGGMVFSSSPAIGTDGTSIYTGGTNGATHYFIKILAANYSVTQTATWTGSTGEMHGMAMNTVDGFFYGTSVAGLRIAKVQLSNLALTNFTLATPLYATDDMAFIPVADSGSLGFNMIVIGRELRTGANIGGFVLNVDDMVTSYNYDWLPSYGVYYDQPNARIINLAIDGFIEVVALIDFLAFIDFPTVDSKYIGAVYTVRDTINNIPIVPNELIITPGNRLFITNWYDNSLTGNLMEIELNKVPNPVLTKTEGRYRLA